MKHIVVQFIHSPAGHDAAHLSILAEGPAGTPLRATLLLSPKNRHAPIVDKATGTSDFTFFGSAPNNLYCSTFGTKQLFYTLRAGSVIYVTLRNSLTSQQETAMGSSDNDLNALNSIITVAGALAAIFGGVAGVAGLATFLGTGAGS